MVDQIGQRTKIIKRLSGHFRRTGLSQISLRQLAAAGGISDRMLLYYFADKAEVLAATMAQIAAEIAAQLDAALPIGAPMSPEDFIGAATQLTTGVKVRP